VSRYQGIRSRAVISFECVIWKERNYEQGNERGEKKERRSGRETYEKLFFIRT